MANNGSHPALSHLDGMAAAWSDVLLLVGRIGIGGLMLASGYGKLANIAGATGYLTSVGVPSPGTMVWVVGGTEFVLGAALILGIATRYAAIATFTFVVIATVIAHRYWTYPAPAQGAQYSHFIKNMAILGGALCCFVAGAGRLSGDAKLAKS
jgi:putative oxidoreductase